MDVLFSFAISFWQIDTMLIQQSEKNQLNGDAKRLIIISCIDSHNILTILNRDSVLIVLSFPSREVMINYVA